ncbi:DUF4870 domain-containing protein [Candidatus Aminicenantes bacterium AC-708-M15]|jgi:hypothetical protein|nr:DUF4870 domain-containing protein [SCandidatus Aminicenantes bacterium Aminicenantia_JdfR_composite]MCP2596662.1 DUF4870 domain-containing protein [Candidatus Aminicenantes bacterium AC-335-G13]MCP2603934.1 DUF4870 domain-containing protein [Candidatus Aminicenantes bacterium AC-708-M15]MCP2606359.1 DUF4870 domain-containing protein [Candidatus Aminicenantes bacterium AC-708-I09]MCP2618564.1 DUF4870 domain-containing protein [Candidatus Aminicenantes bacterium AC-335-A11]
MTTKISESQERNWAVLIHLSALAGFIIPFGNILAPLIIWLLKKEGAPFIDDQGKEAVNFQISMTIYAIISAILIVIIIGFVLLIAIGLLEIIFIIIAAVNASNGVKYRYPLSIRFIK